MGRIQKIEYTDNGNDSDIVKEKIEISRKILEEQGQIKGLKTSDLIIASQIAIKNGNWSGYLNEKSK